MKIREAVNINEKQSIVDYVLKVLKCHLTIYLKAVFLNFKRVACINNYTTLCNTILQKHYRTVLGQH